MTRPLALTLLLAVMLSARTAGAQAPLPGDAAPSYSSAELDRIVSPIALYPDPLLAQVLAATTYPGDIPEAARWADGHGYLTGQNLTEAIGADQVPWDPSVQALLPFPSVLDMMARDMPWTQELGDAVLADREGVMDAVQRMRHEAWTYGYLRSNGSVVVNDGPYIEIEPVLADVIAVPVYDPRIVFAPPRRGFAIATAIRFGSGVSLGIGFEPWGWGGAHFVWPSHTVVINRSPWLRTWSNRRTYVHPYDVRRYAGERPPERHELRPRDDRERHAHR
ncbi:MAG TPA: DUF3300 domain-containing protein [Vicinamibacterales bacterium]